MKPSVKSILFLGIIGLQIASVAAIVVFSYITAQQSLIGLANRALSYAAEDSIDHLQEFFKPAQDAAVLTERLAVDDVLRTDDPSLMERYFFNQLRLTAWLDGIFYGGKDGSFIFVRTDDANTSDGYYTKVIAVDGEKRQVAATQRSADFEIVASDFDPTDTFDPRTRPWFEDAVAADGVTWTEPYIFFTSGHPGISTAVAVRNESGQVVGVVGVDIVISELADFLSALNTGEHGAAFILDRSGEIIAFPDADTLTRGTTKLKDGLRFVTAGELDIPVSKAAVLSLGDDLSGLEIAGEVFGRFTADDRAYVSIAVPVPSEDWQWVLGLYLPEDLVLGEIQENLLFNVFLATTIGLVACAIGFFIWRGVARFMDALREGALAVQSGRLETEWTFSSRFRELADTAALFGEMIEGLRRRDRQNTELTNSLRAEIDAHEETESELAISEERYALALAGTNDGIWDWDIASGWILLSPRLAEILGIGTDVERIASKDVNEMIHPDDRQAHRSALVAHLKSRRGFFTSECRLIRRDGSEIWALARGLALWDGDGRAYRMAGSVTDMSERKAAEEQLRQSQKLEALGSLAGGIAHEFNNQLLPIMALTGLALDNLREDSEARGNLEQVLAAAERSRDLIEQILTYSRQRPDRPQPVILKEVVAKSLELLRSALPSNVKVHAELGEESGAVVADWTQIQSVVLNLATNAAHAIGTAQGSITVTVRPVALAIDAATVALGLPPGAYLELSVADTGQGMDAKTKDRIFEPFFTTKPEGQGTGMGLAIVSGIVAGMQGAITVDSQEGEGTTFRILLPRITES